MTFSEVDLWHSWGSEPNCHCMDFEERDENDYSGGGFCHALVESEKLLLEIISGRELVNPIEIDVYLDVDTQNESFYIATNEMLGIHGVGLSLEEAIIMFQEEIEDDYSFYKEIPDSQLTEKAIQLKRVLLSLFLG